MWGGTLAGAMTRGWFAGLLVLLTSLSAWGQSGLPPMAQVEGSEVRVAGDRVAVGLKQGGVVVYHGPKRLPEYGWNGNLGAPVSDILLAQDEVWWLVKDRDELRLLKKGWTRPAVIDLSTAGLTRPALRLSGWRGGVFVHGDTDAVLIDSRTLKGKTLERALPKNVVTMARQGMLLTNWDGFRGILISARRYGRHRSDRNPEEIPDITMFTAWSVDRKGAWKRHGAYTNNLIRMQDAAGPQVEIQLNGRRIHNLYGWGPVDNIVLNDEGMVALGYDYVKVVPFTDGSWLPDTLEPGVPPQYATTLTTSAGNAWWSDGRRLYCAGLEEGATDVYLPNDPSTRVVGLAADEDGAWVLTTRGLRRLVAWREDLNGYAGFTRFTVGDGDVVDTDDQERLAEVTSWISAVDAKGLDPFSFARKIYAQAGITLPSRASAMEETRPGKRIYGEVRYGDLILGPKTAAVYVGNGVTLRSENGTLVRGLMRLDAGSRILRYQATESNELAYNRVPDRPAAEDFLAPYVPNSVTRPSWTPGNPLVSTLPPMRRRNRISEVGIGRPRPSLGHSTFVRINPGGPFDRPTRPEHFRMLDIAKSYFHMGYLLGANGPDRIDCSGFVHQVFRRMGISIPRQSQAIGQFSRGEVVTDELRFGDVLVFRYPQGHVGIYVGNGRMVETTRSSPRGGPGFTSVYRRSQGIVRRFLQW